ncbi:MAG: hypothetical protein D6806_14560 [Deltaproteobacteria bacterium]|nr:MAG: hypothetical protein D6806_14560 [Deltaproteobacteria bacterium]
MDRVSSNGSIQVNLEQPRQRVTPRNDFGSMLKRGFRKTMQAVAEGTGIISRAVPQVGFVSAVSNLAAQATSEAEGVTTGNPMLDQQAQLLEDSFQNSLKLLEMQRRMNRENQAFTLASNIEKVRHEMAKTAINNMR